MAAEQPAFEQYQSYEQLRAYNFELQETYPHLARVELAGYSSDRTAKYPDGRPLEALIVADPEYEAARPYALIQVEHDNELPPMSAQQLMACVFCKNPDLLDSIGYNLIFFNTACADGLALQRWVEEGEGQFDPVTYALWGYRPTAAEQIAWGYPFKYKTASFTTPSSEVQAFKGMAICKTYQLP